MPPTITAIIQARMSSSRLPGKVLLGIAGKPMLQRVVTRAQKARSVDLVVIATTTDPSDDAIEQLCLQRGYLCYRGSPPDVLDRYYQAANKIHADVIVRLTADCPLLDPEVLDLTVNVFLGKFDGLDQSAKLKPQTPIKDHFPLITRTCDFAANRLPPPWKRTLPIGLDTEVCSFAALERAWREADQLYHREHVMPYLYEGVAFDEAQPSPSTTWYVEQGISPRGFWIALLDHQPDYGSLRWTVDTPADLELIRQVYTRFEGRDDFTWQEVLALFEREPELATINTDVKHKSAFDVDQRTSST
jgi:spore coat polysaccharide biosynthesis protein SpsF